ncbi:hypothetical protein D5018_08055 [Parashewanella curva]|uniref:Uncharacterized protein n=1 Tax=Parashewanella curva TaxID=2338552 RepID=A0A3L8Q093_9GAMM|nr:hypothetical protein [Parashewanella curva]RLV60208.1 hypothetical protein D5018_08055 [Parashewanella curva]
MSEDDFKTEVRKLSNQARYGFIIIGLLLLGVNYLIDSNYGFQSGSSSNATAIAFTVIALVLVLNFIEKGLLLVFKSNSSSAKENE